MWNSLFGSSEEESLRQEKAEKEEALKQFLRGRERDAEKSRGEHPRTVVKVRMERPTSYDSTLSVVELLDTGGGGGDTKAPKPGAREVVERDFEINVSVLVFAAIASGGYSSTVDECKFFTAEGIVRIVNDMSCSSIGRRDMIVSVSVGDVEKALGSMENVRRVGAGEYCYVHDKQNHTAAMKTYCARKETDRFKALMGGWRKRLQEGIEQRLLEVGVCALGPADFVADKSNPGAGDTPRRYFLRPGGPVQKFYETLTKGTLAVSVSLEVRCSRAPNLIACRLDSLPFAPRGAEAPAYTPFETVFDHRSLVGDLLVDLSDYYNREQ